VRHINIDDLSLPPDWEDRAKKVLDKLVEADPSTRKQLISDNTALWGELKTALSALSNGKCWYCDSRQIRSDNAVDHFRPKNGVADCKGHEGYWWLAFDWRNYRFSCTYCNSRRKGENTSGGKGDQFPLIDEALRALKWGDNWNAEQPMLLDPTQAADPELLWFYIDGTPQPKFGEDEDKIKHKRATISIRLYHLDEERLEEKRRDLYQQLSRLVTRGNEALDDAAQTKDAIVKARAKKRFADVVNEIRGVISDSAELSSVAKVFLLTFSTTGTVSQGRWIKQLLMKLHQSGGNQ
jgi:uncharacterized protein (TIGR02646 family)